MMLFGLLCTIFICFKTCYGELTDREDNSNSGNCENEKERLHLADQEIKIMNLVNTIMTQNVKIANLESTIMAQNAKITNPERAILAQNVKIANLESAIMAQNTEFEKLAKQVFERRINQITSDYRLHKRLQQEIEQRKHLNKSQNALAENMKASETNHSISIDKLKATQSVLKEQIEMCLTKQSVLESNLQNIANETAELAVKLEINEDNIQRSTNLTRTLKRKDCQDVLREGNSVSGVYNISTVGPVYCDMDTDGGGWTVFQHRYDGSVDFYRTWADYKTGFGNLHKEFWLGNDNIHRITEQGNYKLRIQMEDFSGNKRYAEYSSFSVADENNKYRLNIGSYSGTAGDSLIYHNNMVFSTKDGDNDEDSDSSCSRTWRGAWWYKNCYYSNLNGLYMNSKTSDYKYNAWRDWPGGTTNMKITTMMIRKM